MDLLEIHYGSCGSAALPPRSKWKTNSTKPTNNLGIYKHYKQGDIPHTHKSNFKITMIKKYMH